jgi:murein DD-endopeptidase MepM/ murein hydrolase activator NlpD
MNSPKSDLKYLLRYLVIYQSKKSIWAGNKVERFKNSTVDILMLNRGRLQKRIYHGSMITLAGIGVLTSGVMGGNSIVASSLPGSGNEDPRIIQTFDPNTQGISLNSIVNLKTAISDKPRAEIIDYEVKTGETVSQIAEKFGVDTDTIKWANDLTNINSVKPGDTLKIMPVTGVAVTVKSGDNLESLAKKYSASAQGILDYPFNDVPDDQRLKVGQVLIIPDGSPPEAPAPAKPKVKPQYLAQGSTGPTFSAPAGGSFIWPAASQGVSTYFAWWHPGIDLPNRSAPAIVASDGGRVVVAGWPDNYGYGNRVVIDHGNGYQTLYAHLSNVYVSSGQQVSRGQSIGQMGNTGRSTGTHLHFEIHFRGIAINPLAILR